MNGGPRGTRCSRWPRKRSSAVDADERLRRAAELYAAGAFAEAEAILVPLAAQTLPSQKALLLLGASAIRAGNLEMAIDSFKRILSGYPGDIEATKGLGLAYRKQGRLTDALAAYEAVLQAAAGDVDTHVNMASILRTQEETAKAISHLKRAITLQPGLAVAYLNLGNCYWDCDELDQAGAAYLQCLRLDPRAAPAAIGLAGVFRAQTNPQKAELTLRTAQRLSPDDAELLAHLGRLAYERGEDSEALALLARAEQIAPDSPVVLHHAAAVERALGLWDQAETHIRRALELVPDDSDFLLELARTLSARGDPHAASGILAHARKSYETDPEVRYSCALAALADGDLIQGWSDFSWRMRTRNYGRPRFCHLPKLDAPRFDGVKTVIWGDQGVGDEIIYGSLLQDMRNQSSNIVCEIDRRLAPLFRRGFPELSFVERSFQPAAGTATEDEAAAWRAASLAPALMDATRQIALPDLGTWLRPDFASFPRHAGYLRADPERVADFRRWLAAWRGDDRIVGVSWKSQRAGIGRSKSVSLADIAAGLPADGIRFVSLQYGSVAADIAEAEQETSRAIAVAPGLDCFDDLDGLAALITACDAVVAVSNVTAHLAGSLGKPTGLLCGAAHPWYWFRGRHDSPWYPSLRIFRQEREGSWAAPLAACARWIARS